MEASWIREQLEKTGKTQRALADALNIDTTAVNRLVNGKRRIQADEADTIRAFFSGKINEQKTRTPLSAKPEIPAPDARVINGGPKDQIKVMGMAEGGKDGWCWWNGDVVEWIDRPPELIGVPNGYAVYVMGTSMEPRYAQGERLYIHPGKPVVPGRYVLVQRKPVHEGDSPLAIVKRLVRRTATKVILEQFNPPKTIEVPADEIMSMHRVVGSGEP